MAYGSGGKKWPSIGKKSSGPTESTTKTPKPSVTGSGFPAKTTSEAGIQKHKSMIVGKGGSPGSTNVEDINKLASGKRK